jgi:hypothetical protein
MYDPKAMHQFAAGIARHLHAAQNSPKEQQARRELWLAEKRKMWMPFVWLSRGLMYVPWRVISAIFEFFMVTLSMIGIIAGLYIATLLIVMSQMLLEESPVFVPCRNRTLEQRQTCYLPPTKITIDYVDSFFNAIFLLVEDMANDILTGGQHGGCWRDSPPGLWFKVKGRAQ